MKKLFLGFITLILLSLSANIMAIEIEPFDSIKYSTESTLNKTSNVVFEDTQIFVVKCTSIDSDVLLGRRFNATGENTQTKAIFNSNFDLDVKNIFSNLNMPYEVGWRL